jgi:cytoskeletal protein RodZ
MMQSVDTVVQQPVNYSYMVDNTARPVHYQEQAIVSYQHTSPSPHLTGYHTRHSSAPMAQSQAYAQYQNHQSYIASSPHEEAVPMMQHASMHAQQLAYSMPANLKTE